MEQRRLASTEWVDIVNEENEVIAQASREQMRAQCLRHRATYIVVHDGMGKILVQRRTETKDFLPGMLDATAGGVNRPGFPGECFICELRLPDHRFRWKH
ncbi:NUDIX hydrolase YfcD, partial [Escherichia coli]|uniref:NUDIX hydrolase YfcD n=1 Tax=Escherichia coli TaxID=562 RepID=UPI00201AC4C0